jgi:DNA gyrase subunit A
MRLQRLTGLERDKIMQEYAETVALIKRLREILADEREVLKIISADLAALKVSYADPRRTEIADAASEIELEDMIVEEDMVVTVSHDGYIKRNPVSAYRQQRRGGRGKIGATTKGDDFVEHMFVASTHSYVLFFTNRGRVYWKKVHELPLAGRATRGKAIVNLLALAPGEALSAFLPVRDFVEGKHVVFATAQGVVKKTELMEYSRPRASGIIAINLEENDELIAVRLTEGAQQIALSTRQGLLVRFEESEVRAMGRSATGVRGANLRGDDRVVSMEIVEPGASLLTVSDNGYGKRTPIDEYRLVHRGAKGVITMNVSDRTGPVVGVLQVTDDADEIMIVTNGGKMIRLSVGEIRKTGRAAQGVRLVNLGEEGAEQVASVAPIAREEVGAAGEDGADDTEAELDEDSALETTDDEGEDEG